MPPRPLFGWRPDPPKLAAERPDHDATPLLGTAPPPNRASALELIVSILDQGASDCVVHSAYQNIRGSHVRQGVLSPELGSRRMGYWCSRAFHHATGEDDGTYLRTFFQAQNKFGFCRESVYPYDSPLNDMPSSAAWRAANDQRDVGGPIAYRRIQSAGRARIDDIKRAIAAGYLVSFGTLVSTAFARNDLGKGPLLPPIGQEIAGGHALLVGAYEDDDFTIVNSWGEEWGGRGLCRFNAAYLEWAETSDLWLVERAPEFSE
jgi:hypothetical protein